MKFEPTTLSRQEEELRAEVRKFLAEDLPAANRGGLGLSSGQDRSFSRKLGERGWLGMALPRRYGGHDRTAVDRFVVVEELLAAGAPVSAHWVADRQSGPTILKFGTEAQRERFLPAIARGELAFSIGMSEPDSGSDLASVRTTATRAQDGWLLNGTKVWTSGAHEHDWFIVLCRTSPLEDDRHQGLSQMLVDLRTPGIEINPIPFLDGSHHFNEVVLRDIFVPDELVLGEVGMGWQQVTSELAYERAGPDRYMSAYRVLEEFLRARVTTPEPAVSEALGGMVARLWGIRQLSLSVSKTIDEGGAPAVEAALVKDLGTIFEQEMVETLRRLADTELDLGDSSLFESLLARSTVAAPSYTLRGGTSEILRSVAAKGLSRTTGGPPPATTDDGLLERTVQRILDDRAGPEAVREAETTGWAPELWDALSGAGLPWVGIPEEAGGSGGTLSDAASMLRLLGYYAAPVPFGETGMLGGWLLARSGLPLPGGPVTVALGQPQDRLELRRDGGRWTVVGELHRVPWARRAEQLVALTPVDGVEHVVAIPMEMATVHHGANLAGEPRDRVVLEGVSLGADAVAAAPDDVDQDALLLRGALVRASLMAGACRAAAQMSVTHAQDRVQFGQPIARFQAVQHHIVRAAGEAALAGMVAEVAASTLDTARSEFEVATAKVVAGRAARAVTAAAHQVHGAMGMTREHDLQLRTRRLWSWADECGSEARWARRLGEGIAAHGADQLWARIATGLVAS